MAIRPYGEFYVFHADPHELRNLYAERRPELVAMSLEAFVKVIDETEDLVHPSFHRFTGTVPGTGRATDRRAYI
ncbi:MAG: hypothetical protein KAU31_16210 [Spirochaetaceae bacterium]|nr:hypothetical protein [Spirochaetaceae bacterium]